MTGPVPPLSQAGAPDDPPGGPPRVSLGKALVLLVVAVVVGIVLLQVGSRAPVGVTSPTTVATTATTTPHSSSTTTAAPVDKANVKVQVANATTTDNAAGFFSTKLDGDGWQTLPALDATSMVPTTAVYYAAGQQPAAASIASSLGLKASAVQPLTTSVPVSGTTGDDVVVVIGADLAGQVTSTTTTT
ncbi:MAG: LytR C-terminal domain-containing protein [Acidimicrobiales bacterium]